MTTLDQARAIGDAVLYEGYLLYPYRASAGKNRMRWQWGVLMPPAFAARDEGEHADCQAQCLVEPRAGTMLHVRLRFLHAQARDVLVHGEKVPGVTVAGTEYLSWDEAVERELDVVTPVAGVMTRRFTVPAAEELERVADGIELRRRTQSLSGSVEIFSEPLRGPYGGVRLTVRVTNTGEWDGGVRDDALHHALVAAHLVLAVDSGHFLSLLDPPEWAGPATEACVNTRLWPVLVGPDVMLASPIILYDHPVIAPESPGAMFDGLEIDEILTLRTMALTDDEKREARATDPRAREIIDRADGLPPEWMDRLHGAVRSLGPATGQQAPWWDPGADASVSPETDHVVVAGVPVAAGNRVRLRPRRTGTDAQDMFLTGREATVHAVLSDVDGETHLAVTVDDDPAAELQHAHGRYRYFSPDEIEVLP